jgi:hypothetical protein
VLKEVYEMNDDEIKDDMKNWKKKGNKIGYDGDEMSYLVVRLDV